MTTASASSVLNKQLEAINAHDAQTFVSCYDANAVVFDPAYPELLRGRDAIAKDISDFFTAFPDMRASVTRMVEDGDTIAFEMSMRGTHRGPLVASAGHIPATNRSVEFRGAIFAKLDGNGLIAEEHRYYDLAGLLGQLGQLQ